MCSSSVVVIVVTKHVALYSVLYSADCADYFFALTLTRIHIL